MKSWALKLAPRGITVNAIAPGVFAGGLTMDEAKIPAGRMGKPEDLAAALRFLLGEDSGYITGNSITASGGYGI
jgi:3-oxoacyl-[acyl-carrier protein] reductase